MKALTLITCLAALGLAAGPLLAQTTVTTTTLAPPRLGGYIQVREVAQEGVGLSASLNRARFSIDGPLPARFTYRFLVELEAPAGSPSTGDRCPS